jgi:hypothetical protein
MNKKEQAKVMLEEMDNSGIQIDWGMEKHYITGIVNGLNEVESSKETKSIEVTSDERRFMEEFYTDHIVFLEEMIRTDYADEPRMQERCREKIEKIRRLLWKF